MLRFLLALVVLLIALQAGLMAMVRKLVQQLDQDHRRLDGLEQRIAEIASSASQPPAPSSATFHLAPAPQAAAAAAAAAPAMDQADTLRSEMLSLMRQLVEQGLSVRDVAARCGLSEAEAELMLSLHEGAS